MATIQYVVSAQDAASATFERIAGSADHVLEKLDEIGAKTAKARVEVDGDQEAELTIDKLDLKMAKFADRVAKGKLGVDGGAAAMLEIRKLELEMDKLNAKTAKIHIDTSALSKLSAFQPSALGTAVALSPALIPLAGQIAGAVGAISISFGAATLAAGAFGLMAGTVLSGASTDLQKLQTLNLNLAKASTAAQKKAIEQQIAQLKAGWSKGYLDLIDNYKTFQTQWKSVSQAVTVPALNAWIPALTKGLQLLKPLLTPVADLFKSWGQSLDRYFSNPVTVLHLKDIAATLGNFAAIQIGQIAKFITDLAKGFANLARDLPAGTQLGAAGTGLMNIGDAFLAWSKSAKARNDVQGFMQFLHDEGPVITGILSDLGTLLPGIFAGATTVGTLELQALGNFLNLVASLPPGWQKPVTELAGAMLLLSKIGVVKVGIKLTGLGLDALGAAGAGAAGGPLAAAGAAMAAGFFLRIREDFKAGAKGFIRDIPNFFSGTTGIIGVMAQGWADVIVSHFQKPALAAEKAFGRAFVASAQTSWNAVTASMRAFADTMVASMKAFGSALVASARAAWNAVTASFRAFAGTVESSMRAFGSVVASIWNAIRTSTAAAWNTIWNNTVARVRSGIATVMTAIRAMPGAIRAVFNGALTWLVQAGKNVIQGLLNGLTAIWNKVKSFISSIAGWIKAHKGPISLDSTLLEPAGRALMSGLHLGLTAGSKGPLGFISGLTGTIGSLLSGGVGAITSLLGGGGHAGPGGGAPSANAALARRLMPAWGSGANWAAWNYLAMRESGWSNIANNPSSGAYGIAQALPPTKYPLAGRPPWLGGSSNPTAQITWMIGYINQRYQGSPVIAAQHEAAFNWYDRGGWLPPGASIAINNTGQPEQVVGPASMTHVVTLLAQILSTLRVAPAATSAGTARALNSAARSALGAR